MLAVNSKTKEKKNSTLIAHLSCFQLGRRDVLHTQALCELQGAVVHDTDGIEGLREQLEVIAWDDHFSHRNAWHVWMRTVANNAHCALLNNGPQRRGTPRSPTYVENLPQHLDWDLCNCWESAER